MNYFGLYSANLSSFNEFSKSENHIETFSVKIDLQNMQVENYTTFTDSFMKTMFKNEFSICK